MSVLVTVTLIAVAVLVLTLAAYLLAVIAVLVRVDRTARRILHGTDMIAERTQPLGLVLDDVNRELLSARDELRRLLPAQVERVRPVRGRRTART